MSSLENHQFANEIPEGRRILREEIAQTISESGLTFSPVLEQRLQLGPLGMPCDSFLEEILSRIQSSPRIPGEVNF